MDYPKFTTGDFTWTNSEKTEAAFVANPDGRFKIRWMEADKVGGIDPHDHKSDDDHPNNSQGY